MPPYQRKRNRKLHASIQAMEDMANSMLDRMQTNDPIGFEVMSGFVAAIGYKREASREYFLRRYGRYEDAIIDRFMSKPSHLDKK